MNNLPFGVDVSSWQGIINWNTIATHQPKVCFAFIRASQGTGFIDPHFKRNWTEAKSYGIARGAYHYMQFDQDLSGQMNSFIKTLEGDFGELPLVLDCEADGGKTKAVIKHAILHCSSLIKNLTRRDPIIYSRALWINEFVEGGPWLNDFYWWLAQYLFIADEHPGPVLLPKGLNRDRCLVHQTTSHGAPIGVNSKQMDYDRWQFDLSHFQSFVAPYVSTPAQNAGELTVDKKVDILWKAHPELHL